MKKIDYLEFKYKTAFNKSLRILSYIQKRDGFKTVLEDFSENTLEKGFEFMYSEEIATDSFIVHISYHEVDSGYSEGVYRFPLLIFEKKKGTFKCPVTEEELKNYRNVSKEETQFFETMYKLIIKELIKINFLTDVTIYDFALRAEEDRTVFEGEFEDEDDIRFLSESFVFNGEIPAIITNNTDI